MIRNLFGKISGYSLMELSIVMSIVAILATGGLLVVGKQDESNRLRITLERLAIIEQTIQGFVSSNGYLPCPANGNFAETNVNYGKPLYEADGTCTIQEGMLPIRNDGTNLAYNMLEEIVYDGWNRRFRYRIAENFHDQESFDNDENRGNISVQDIRGHEKTNINLKEPLNFGAAYIVLSHGPNGYGAWLKTGSQIGNSPESRENENSDDDVVYVQNGKTSVFDDILIFKRKIDLVPPKIQYANLVTPDAECHHAGSIAKLGKPGTGGILDALDGAGYSDLAEQVYKSAIALKKVCDNPPRGAFTSTLSCVASSFAPIGSETQVNTYTTSTQDNLSLTSLTDGQYVVVWQSLDQDGDQYGIYGRMFDKDGAAVSSEFQVSTTTDGQQEQPFVVSTSYGYVVSWVTNYYGPQSYLFMQKYFNSGAVYGAEYSLSIGGADLNQEPHIAVFSDDRYVLTWHGLYNADNNADIYIQQYTSSGIATGSTTKVNTVTAESQQRPRAATTTADGFVIIWESYDTTATQLWDVKARRYDSTGTAIDASEFQINGTSAGDQRYPDIIRLTGGGFVVVWESDGEIYGRMYDDTFTATASEFQINTTTTNTQAFPHVAATRDGGFVVSWSSLNQDGSAYGVYHRRYDSTGSAEAGEYLTNTTTTDSQYVGKITGATSNPHFLTGWQSHAQDGDRWGIYIQLFSDGSSC